MKKTKLVLKVCVDTNDADYAFSENEISENDLKKLKPLFQAIKNFKPYEELTKDNLTGSKWLHRHNYPYGECLREDLGEKSPSEIYSHIDPEVIELFEQEYIPYSEYGFHTIKSIELAETKTIEKFM